MLEIEDIAAVVAGAVREATAPLVSRIAELEARELPAMITAEEVRLIAEEKAVDISPLAERIAELEARELPDVKALVADEVATAVAALPPAEKCEDGADVDMAEVQARIETAVKSAVQALPAPKDGRPGKDGIGLADALKDAEGNLVLVMTDGRTKSLGPVDGKPGEPGRDGITPTFLDAEFEGRTLRLKFDGERSCEFQLAVPEYVGVFKESETYETGDMVSWAGSCWHCDEPKGLKPGSPDSGWTLAVKAGRPGKDTAK